MISGATLLRTVGAFQSAALGLGSWEAALRGLAEATGSKHAQLIGLGSEAAVPFNLMSDAPPGTTADFLSVNGADPNVNSRVRIGSRAPALAVLGEPDFDTAGDMGRHPDYGDFIRQYDIPDICLTTLVRGDGLLVGLSVMRSERQGEFDDAARAVFAQIAPYVRNAVNHQIALQHNAAALVAGAMGSLSLAAFVCDGLGRVRAMSPSGEALIAGDPRLKLREGRLSCGNEADTRALGLMLEAAAFGKPVLPPRDMLALHADGGAGPLLIEVNSLPGDVHGFGFGVAAVVLVRAAASRAERAAEHARLLFGLTATEAAVVAGLVEGRSPQAVADRLGASVGTVRTHIRHAFEKVRVRSLGELVAAVTARL